MVDANPEFEIDQPLCGGVNEASASSWKSKSRAICRVSLLHRGITLNSAHIETVKDNLIKF